MQVNKIIDFLETDIISVTFSPNGLKYLSLKNNNGNEMIEVLPQKGIGICRSGAGFLREKLLTLEGHDVDKLRGNYVCKRKSAVWSDEKD
ncbi:hypothetical protein K9O30_07380 [Clostridium bowmanii]|uniref:hypothetical protein n=1 Tax=Clostridium bowmanii TaxID=132925 RepID=UPI001C0C1D95|nr:hypothetical protein [Clostridium bowmanii]MBU3189603.1 hypothetical protein [Clostridium bowmanii]MCA1073553.1 hypothetical protein [Clostridium bowmanii]